MVMVIVRLLLGDNLRPRYSQVKLNESSGRYGDKGMKIHAHLDKQGNGDTYGYAHFAGLLTRGSSVHTPKHSVGQQSVVQHWCSAS